MVGNQCYVFVAFVLNGMIIGLILDSFRIFRRLFKSTNLMIYIQDILFWILTGISIIFFMYNFSNGTLRLFTVIGIILGLLVYLLTISKYVIEFFNYMHKLCKTTINIFCIPAKFIIMIIYKALIKQRTKVQQIVKNLKKLKNDKNIKIKKGF